MFLHVLLHPVKIKSIHTAKREPKALMLSEPQDPVPTGAGKPSKPTENPVEVKLSTDLSHNGYGQSPSFSPFCTKHGMGYVRVTKTNKGFG